MPLDTPITAAAAIIAGISALLLAASKLMAAANEWRKTTHALKAANQPSDPATSAKWWRNSRMRQAVLDMAQTVIGMLLLMTLMAANPPVTMASISQALIGTAMVISGSITLRLPGPLDH